MRALFSIILLAAAMFSSTAHASLVGQDVSCISPLSGSTLTCQPQSATVGDGSEFTVELPGLGEVFEIDLFSDAIELRNPTTSTFVVTGTEILVLGPLTWGGGGTLTGFSLTDLDLGGGNPFSGFDNAISLAPSFAGLSIDLTGVTIAQLAGIRIDLEATHPVPVPVPPTLLLISVAFGVIGGLRSLRKRVVS